jgi:hypothetical protein
VIASQETITRSSGATQPDTSTLQLSGAST